MMSNNNRVTSMIIHHVDKNPYIIENSHRLRFKLVIIPLIPWKYTSGYYSINMMSNNNWVNTSYIIENSYEYVSLRAKHLILIMTWIMNQVTAHEDTRIQHSFYTFIWIQLILRAKHLVEQVTAHEGRHTRIHWLEIFISSQKQLSTKSRLRGSLVNQNSLIISMYK